MSGSLKIPKLEPFSQIGNNNGGAERFLEHQFGAHFIEGYEDLQSAYADTTSNMCLFCNKSFSRRDHLKRHISAHFGMKPHECTQCRKTFLRREHLRRHIATHLRGKQNGCFQCGLIFNTRSELDIHLINHTRTNQTLKCHLCEAVFSRHTSLEYHIFEDHGENNVKSEGTHSNGNQEMCTCPQCGFIVDSKKQLKTHLLSHKEKKFKCSFCDRPFLRKDHLNRHIMCCHGDGRQFKCGDCGKVFLKKEILSQHSFVHLLIPPKVCSSCGYMPENKEDWKQHWDAHLRELELAEAEAMKNPQRT